MKLQTKLLLNSFVIIVMALLILTYIIFRMMSMQTTATTFSNSLLNIEQMNSAIVSYQQALDNFGKNATEGNLANAITKYNDMLEKVDTLSDIPTVISNEEIRRIDTIQTKVDVLQKDMNVVIEQGETIEAMMLSTKLFGIMNDIYLLNLSMKERYAQLIKQNNDQVISIAFTSGLVLLVASTLINILITKRILKPIQTLSDYSKEIAAGNLAIKEIEFTSRDEVGLLTNSFNRMKKNLHQSIEKIQSNANALKEKNERINDSIDYAKRIQDSVLPANRLLLTLFQEHFLIYKQRDTVGGDFYWCKETERGFYIAVADCTGHGVPGALMTTLSISALNQIVDDAPMLTPADILERLNRKIKQSLNQQSKSGLTDDGLDIGLCFIEGKTVTFSGSKLSLYVKREDGLTIIKGDKKSIGYRRTPYDYSYTNAEVIANENTIFYITTDGYVDQNGGEKNYSFGKKNLVKLIEENYLHSMESQKEGFVNRLEEYKGIELQRDDITVIGFKI
ncbi:SpoIIE family protein phosphatase [Bacillus sp. FJAT-45350]|uniref:SpoIIE family protein phosphatase n=1 Tax=Bacillus sp. FJAT-45350 TaxID=2011014 RepID=UPI000BB7A017|nr:SpoIIE family protein phosphatase [Bacillus sp. FJAT-45350]